MGEELLREHATGDDGERGVSPPDQPDPEVRELHLLEGPAGVLERVLDELLDDREHRGEQVPVLRVDHPAGEVGDQDPALRQEEHLLDLRADGRGREAELLLEALRGGLDLELREPEVCVGPDEDDETRSTVPEVPDHDLRVLAFEDHGPRRLHPDELRDLPRGLQAEGSHRGDAQEVEGLAEPVRDREAVPVRDRAPPDAVHLSLERLEDPDDPALRRVRARGALAHRGRPPIGALNRARPIGHSPQGTRSVPQGLGGRAELLPDASWHIEGLREVKHREQDRDEPRGAPRQADVGGPGDPRARRDGGQQDHGEAEGEEQEPAAHPVHVQEQAGAQDLLRQPPEPQVQDDPEPAQEDPPPEEEPARHPAEDLGFGRHRGRCHGGPGGKA